VAVFLAGLSALMYGAGDFCGGVSTKRGALVPVLVTSQLIGMVIAVGASLAMGTPLPAAADLAWGVLGGVCGAAGLGALYTALASSPVAVASPLAAVVGAAIPVALGLTLGERPGLTQWIGIAVSLPAIVLLTAGPRAGADAAAARRAALLGTVAGIGFGLFFFAVSRTSHASGLWPLVAARIVTISVVAAWAVATRRSLDPRGPGLPFAALSGVLDMGANIAFLLASRLGALTITAVVTSLYPGPTVILAVVVLRERLGAARAAGLALALAGVALIAA
jgi:drug/metabolite transporter (DMT)-like permease